MWCLKSSAVLLSTVMVSICGQAIANKPASSAYQGPPQDKGDKDKAAAEQKAKEKEHEPKPYDQVITNEAKSNPGIFTVHAIKEKYYYEIPKNELGKDFLWVTNIAKNAPGVSYGGDEIGSRVVRWERHGNRVLLRDVSYAIVANRNEPISTAVNSAQHPPIIMSFNIEAFGKDDAPVIEVTKLFSTEVQEFSARRQLNARGYDNERSYVERITPYPQNIEAESTQTYTKPIEPPNPTAPPTPNLGGMTGNSATVLMHFSMVKLPENPMQPRMFDERVGYFTVEQRDYGRNENKAVERRYITRWRLEKKDPAAESSEPTKPIIYYLDPATPEKWRSWIKKGVEDWQPAFEMAGFKHAIQAKDAPTPEEDPNWSPEDVRYSVIRWIPSTIENAFGPHISDPRTGEILNADIHVFHNVLKLINDWYFVQVGPLDPRVEKLPVPDELIGRLLEYVIAHEVGHTLGFPHNMKSSSLYPADKMRDPAWLHKMGHVATLMDYSRFNYVAQPEDNVPAEDLIPKVGPYDKWATMWGYKPIPGANSPDREKSTLDEWAREQDKTPWFRFSTPGSYGSDPGENTEAVGDADAVSSTTLGMKNLARVTKMALKATNHPSEPYDDLKELFNTILSQWRLEMGHVAVVVGGLDSQEKYNGQSGVIFTPVSRERQRAAVRFLNENAFRTPAFLIQPEILRRIQPAGALDEIRGIQSSILSLLLAEDRLGRLVEEEALDSNSYRPAEFLGEVRNGIWSELSAAHVKIDPYRRGIQRSYVDLLAAKVNPSGAAGGGNSRFFPAVNVDTAPAYYRAEMKSLKEEIGRAIVKSADADTRAHLDTMRDRIDRALDPKFAPIPLRSPGFDGPKEPISCWPDYTKELLQVAIP